MKSNVTCPGLAEAIVWQLETVNLFASLTTSAVPFVLHAFAILCRLETVKLTALTTIDPPEVAIDCKLDTVILTNVYVINELCGYLPVPHRACLFGGANAEFVSLLEEKGHDHENHAL